MKTIALRGKKELVAVFNRYGRLSGNQNQGRPQSTEDFVRYIAGLEHTDETKVELKSASKLPIDVSEISDDSVPPSIKIQVNVTDEEWEKAMDTFKYVFDLKGKQPQMPYFLKVAGMACIRKLEEQNKELIIERQEKQDAMDVEKFKELSTDEKLVEIYKLLRERR